MHPCSPFFRIAEWWKSIGVNSIEHNNLSTSLKLSKKQARDIFNYRSFIDFQSDVNKLKNSIFESRKFLSGIKELYGKFTIAFINDIPRSEFDILDKPSFIEIYRNDPLVIKDLKINGDALIYRGLKGKEIGITLQKLLLRVLEEPGLNDNKVLLSLIDEM